MKGGDERRKRARKVKEQSLYILLKRTALEKLWKTQTNPKRLGADRRDLETWQEMTLLIKLLSKKEETEDMPGVMQSAAIPALSFIMVLGKAVGMGPARTGV